MPSGAQPGPAYRDDAEHVAHFRELLEQAVRARVRCVGPLALSVSGGLDSSSIACIVEQLIASGETSVQARLYSYVFDHTPGAGEREYLEAAIGHCPHLEPTIILGDDCWGLREFADDYGYPLDEAAPVALQTAIDYLAAEGEVGIELVHFVLFGRQAYQAYAHALARMDLSPA